MSTLVWIIIFTLTGGLLSVGAAGLFLLIPNRYHPRILPHGLSFAVGALLSVAFLDLLPDALHTAGEKHAQSLLATVLAGIIGFFLLEKLLLWRHCHSGSCVARNKGHSHRSAGALISWVMLFTTLSMASLSRRLSLPIHIWGSSPALR
ncbi:ZIP family metal transporter [Methylomarinum vadi]|uniref:ZIP family metal transporter n=1 Tax=Methylomarinum vadi TaxID=438855 RepID=UPI003898DAE6